MTKFKFSEKFLFLWISSFHSILGTWNNFELSYEQITGSNVLARMLEVQMSNSFYFCSIVFKFCCQTYRDRDRDLLISTRVLNDEPGCSLAPSIERCYHFRTSYNQYCSNRLSVLQSRACRSGHPELSIDEMTSALLKTTDGHHPLRPTRRTSYRQLINTNPRCQWM